MQTNISRYVLSIFSALALLAALIVTTAYAGRSQSTVVKIPFDFQVAGRTLPAGRYVVARSTQASADGLSLKSLGGRAGVFVLTSTVQSGDRQDATRLVFTRYKDQYFLSQYWVSGEANGRQLIKSERENELQNEMAKSGLKPERIAVVIAKR